MFSATKFLVAGAIVALFGGFLLSGVLPQPSNQALPPAGSSPTASLDADSTEQSVRADLLPGVELVTEEVEPGVYRVVSDGVRELSGLPADQPRYMGGVLDTNIAAGLDGSIWLFGWDGFYRLGAEAESPWRNEWREDFKQGRMVGGADIEVGAEGTIWLRSMDRSGIWSFDRTSWTLRLDSDEDEWLSGLAVEEDGTVWTTRSTDRSDDNKRSQPRVTVARLGPDGWEDLPGSVELQVPRTHEVVVADGEGSEVWLLPGSERLRRHDGTGWAVQPTPEVGHEARVAAGADGSLWVRLVTCPSHSGCAGRQVLPFMPSDILARFDGEAWEVFGPEDGIPTMGDHYQGFEGFFEVAPDGSVWFNPNADPDAGSGCDGIASFDGQSVHRYLRGHCITAMDIAPDGKVWFRALERTPDASPTPDRRFRWLPTEPVHTYVITPEATAAQGGAS